METKEVLTWISHNHELVLTALIACLIGLCSIVYSIFKGIRDIIYAFKGIKKKEKPDINFSDNE